MSDVHTKPTRIGETIPSVRSPMPILEAYSIRREIGRGGMAVVYEALEKSLNRTVALKVLTRELSQDTDLIQRFVNEAQAAARISHPNIVQIYSIGEEKGVYYFAMECVRGQSVENILAEKEKIPVLESLNIVKQTVLALREAYKNNIVHRDIKPGNLLITEQGAVKVADFGLAAEIRGAQATLGGKIIGTPLYISPEQAQGKGGDYRSDIYSLGITFYQMLAGSPPFIFSDTKVLMKSHIEQKLPPLPSYIPNPVRKLVYRMTDKDPDKRFQDYDLLLKELDRVNRILTSKKYSLPILSIGLLITIGVTIYSFHYEPMVGELVLPVRPEKDKRIEAIYKNVVMFAKQNPAAYGDIIKEYFKIIKEYPDTEWAFRAEQKIDIIILAVANEAAEELKGLRGICDKLISEKRYKEAIDKYHAIKQKYKDTAAESVAQEEINLIIEGARKEFNTVEEQARGYLNEYNFIEARKLYEEVINSFGLEEFVKEARDKLSFINELEAGHRLESDARTVFSPVQERVKGLLAEHAYEKARELLRSIRGAEENSILMELVKKELAKVDEVQIDYESTALRDRMESQYNYYNMIINKAGVYIADYKYRAAMGLIKEGIEGIEVLEWRQKLGLLQEKLQYLRFIKDGIIAGVNKDLAARKVTNISASDDTLIFIVEGGYVGASWGESRPQEIYQVAKRYLGNSSQAHMALGVFCLTYGLTDTARKEFALVLRIEPQMQGVVEKYLIQLAEAQKR